MRGVLPGRHARGRWTYCRSYVFVCKDRLQAWKHLMGTFPFHPCLRPLTRALNHLSRYYFHFLHLRKIILGKFQGQHLSHDCKLRFSSFQTRNKYDSTYRRKNIRPR